MKNNITTQLFVILGAGSLATGALAGGGGAGGYGYGAGAISGVSGAVGGAIGSVTGAAGNLADGAGSLIGGLGLGTGLLGGVTGSVSAGWDTDYYFRGVDFGGSPIWTGVNLSFPIAEGLSFNPGVWYINPTSSSAPLDDELDYFASLDYQQGAGSIGLVYTGYSFPEAGGETNEFGVNLGYSLYGVDFGAGFFYDVDLETEYYEFNASTGLQLADGISSTFGGTIAVLDDDFSHATLKISIPIALTSTATLEPYAAFNYALDATEGINSDDEEFYGGVSISVSF